MRLGGVTEAHGPKTVVARSTEVLSGLSADVRVAVGDFAELVDGARIRIE
jgi:hypothetical protein